MPKEPRILPTPSHSPQHPLSTPNVAPPARLRTYFILPLMSPALLCNGTHASPEVFPLTALACSRWGFPSLQVVQDPSEQHIYQQGKVSWGPKGQTNPTELSFLFSPASLKKLCARR